MIAVPMRELLRRSEERMKETLEEARREFASVRTGRANPALLDRVMVEYYGDVVPVRHISTVTAPEPRLLVIRPFDRASVGAIRKALLASDLGLNPSTESDLIRLPLPPLTEERRRELVKEVNRKSEEKKVAVRNIRREAIEEMRKQEKAHQISEDDLHRFQEEVQKLTDHYIHELEKLQKAKDEELLET